MIPSRIYDKAQRLYRNPKTTVRDWLKLLVPLGLTINFDLKEK